MARLLSIGRKLKQTLRAIGPGLVTGASDDDPSGIATYSQAGAQFGLAGLWTALASFPLMAAMQGMCARIGLVTGHGLTATLRSYYPPALTYFVILFSFPAITLNIGADIQAMGAVMNMLIPEVPTPVFSFSFTAMMLLAIIRFPYQKIAQILKWLCLCLLLYFIVPFFVQQNWGEVIRHSIIPSFSFDKAFIAILVGLFGTTISPYLFFWQATMEAEDQVHTYKRVVVNKRVLNTMRADVTIGMFLSNLVMYFIILTAASVLHKYGIRDIQTVDQAAKALEPLAGRFSYLVFSLGVIGTGLLAIPVLAGAQSYMLAETFNWKTGLDKKFAQAKPFYLTMVLSLVVGLGLDFFGISPIRALLYTAILYGITAPVLIAVILHIANNKFIMKKYTNSRLSNLLGIMTLLLMTLAAVALVLLQFFG